MIYDASTCLRWPHSALAGVLDDSHWSIELIAGRCCTIRAQKHRRIRAQAHLADMAAATSQGRGRGQPCRCICLQRCGRHPAHGLGR